MATNSLQAQFDQFMATPGTSAEQIKAAEKWLQFATAGEARKVTNWLTERKTKNTSKRRDLATRISDLQGELAQIKLDAGQGLRPVSELLKARRLAIQRLRDLEGAYRSLESTEAHIAVIAGDPVTYMDSLWSKYGIDRPRPNLASHLAKHPADRTY